ncbi:MAG: TMEM165/GDT1 family protein [Sphingomonadaceae bacterium]|nr:TMEM165/GDT1 family protein [Sphingomonadaceae bacterium]
MDAILPVLLVSLVLEIGDGTQLLAGLLGARFRKPLCVIVGIFVAALALSAAAAFAGTFAAAEASHRALRLLLGIALISGGIGGFLRVKPPEPVDGWKLGSLLSSFGAFLILAALDKTMFTTFAFSAADGAWMVTAVAAAAGTTLANVPAVVRGGIVAPRWARPAIGGVLIVIGVIIGVAAIGLI